MKINRILAVWLLLLTVVGVQAADVRYWNEGPLRWSDFSGNPPMKTADSHFCGRLEIRTNVDDSDKRLFNNETLYSTVALAVMDKSQSYADSTKCSDRQLRYYQMLFDKLEVLRRRLQADLNAGMTGIEADARLKYYQKMFDDQVRETADLTKQGTDEERLQESEYFVRKQLDSFSLPDVPSVKPGKFNYGWFIGTGPLVPTGGINEVFKYSWLFNIGLTFGYDRLKLKADISYGQPRFVDSRGNFMGQKNRWATDMYASQLAGTVSLGFEVLHSKHFSITPHVGGGWSVYSWNYADFEFKDDEWNIVSDFNKASLRDFNYMVGIDFDWHFHTVVSDRPFFLSGRREQYTSSLRLTPYFMRASYDGLVPERNGFQVGLMLNYVGLARALGID